MAKTTVYGFKHFDDKIDGDLVQSMTIFVVMPLEENNHSSGSMGQSLKAPMTTYDLLKTELGNFPKEFDVETSLVATKQGPKLQVTSIKPIMVSAQGK